jgi:tetratricopeptide (TPR) repeat protein
MFRLREDVRQSGYGAYRLATCVLTLIALLAPFPSQEKLVYGQSVREQADSATLQGSVRDSRGHPVVAATVYLDIGSGTRTLTARTDSKGSYIFSGLHEGVYSLHTEIAGNGKASFGPFVLGPKEVKRIDLTLESATVSVSPSRTWETPGQQPQFFDEPEFTVAGVIEAMNPGGHGSDTISRTTEALAKQTASLTATAANKRQRSDSVSPGGAVEESLRHAAEDEPGNFDANYRLGKLLVDDGKVREALPYLEQASKLNPGDYENDYELALAYTDTGQYERGRTQARSLLALPDKSPQRKAELHHLLGDLDEKISNPLEAVQEYQRAAELNPSEANLFDWATDLLMHRAYEPAIEVFTKGNRLFPRSARMLAGLGVAWYARGAYDQAAERLCEASDLNPDDPNPYLFLGKMQSVRTTQSECLLERLRRFVKLQPGNALANYYYALGLWNRHESLGSTENLVPVESLLEKAVHLDPKFGAAYLQLGILYAERGDSAKAIAAYQRATDENPQLEEAHYRMAQVYGRTGAKSKAEAELQLYQQLSKKSSEEAEHERHEIQQFVYTLRNPTSTSPPQ